jgi:pteridine reductase
MKEIIEECPGLEIVVNNASVFEESGLEATSLEELDKNLSIHLRSPFVIVREFANKIGKGQVINILDTRITKNKTKYFGYLISKKALADFTRLAASSLGPGIRVNGIAPGLILPPEGKSDEYLKQLAAKIPAQRKGEIKDITAALQFLVENDYITGQIIFEDGGEHLI